MAILMLNIQVVLVTLPLLFIIRSFYRYIFGPLRAIPGPWYTNCTHLVLKWHVITGNRCHYIHKLHQFYGGVVRISPVEIAVAGLEDCLKIHKVNSGFNKTEWYEKLNDQPRNGIFAMRDVREHAFRRKLFAQAFSKTSLRSNWESVVVEKVQSAITKILQEVQFQDVDLLKWWTLMATDVSGHIMFGESFNMLEKGKKDEYIEILETTMMGAGIGVELPLVKLIGKRLPFKGAQLMFNGNSHLTKYAEKAVKNARSSKNIFSNALAEVEKGNGKLDDLDVQVEAGNLIVAGSDTTAVTLTYLIWAVLQRPDLRYRLEEEVKTLPDQFSDVHLEALVLNNATIEEALRLYGAAPGSLPRVVPKDEIIGGHLVPAGCVVGTQAWSLHRDSTIFANADEFRPERWLGEETGSEVMKSAMSAFGKGSRTCIGVHLARMELRYGLVLFLLQCQSLELAPSTTEESMAVENFFLIAPKAHQCMLRIRA